MTAKTEAVANANASLSNVCLPTYNDLLGALRDADNILAIASAHMTTEQRARFREDLEARMMGCKCAVRHQIIQDTGSIGYAD